MGTNCLLFLAIVVKNPIANISKKYEEQGNPKI